jgi:hypothetical protein
MHRWIVLCVCAVGFTACGGVHQSVTTTVVQTVTKTTVAPISVAHPGPNTTSVPKAPRHIAQSCQPFSNDGGPRVVSFSARDMSCSEALTVLRLRRTAPEAGDWHCYYPDENTTRCVNGSKAFWVTYTR